MSTAAVQMSEVVGDFPLVHPAMYGKQTRYAYQAVTDVQDSAAQNKVRWLVQRGDASCCC